MRRLLMLGALALAAGCGTVSYETDEVPADEPAEPPPPASTPEPPAPAPPPNPGPCAADASHCCMADGTLVRPGGCQPSYPTGVQPATERGPDGVCRSVPCNVRCLPASAVIQTPGGGARISELVAGDLVYTRDEAGERVVAPVLRVVAVEVGPSHSLVELSLDDGRRVRGSPGHPVFGDDTLGALRPGDGLDGATVVGVRRLSYDGDATWDLLPAGPTGTYWADDVLLGSTLRPERPSRAVDPQTLGPVPPTP